MRRTIHPRTRGGFTLVELLVVVTIIAVLVALTSAGVIAALARGTEVQARNEVTQLANAVQAFKAQYHVQFIPDRIMLPPGFDAATQQFLASVWPRLDQNMLKRMDTQTYAIPSRVNDPDIPAAQKAVNVFTYWQVQGNQPAVLHGDQVLVWALGGWRDTSNVFGFSTDATDPMKPYVLGKQRQQPFFEGFTTERLRYFPKGSNKEVEDLPNRAPGFPSFVDVYGKMPYLYFSSGKAGNDYSFPIAAPTEVPNFSLRVTPYRLAANKFANPTSFQIICAGRDNLYGTGELAWAGGSGQLTGGVRDDIANFYATKLGD